MHAADPALVRLRIALAYDGGDFSGFARQPDRRTVQGVLEAALARLSGAAVTTVGAGRTDAGVHADLQVVHADVPAGSRIVADLDRARGALDAICGPALTIWEVQHAPASFDARFSAIRRSYRYRICDDDPLPPLWRHHTWHVKTPRLDVGAMQAGGQVLIGEHDFSSFCRRRDDQHLTRRVDAIAVSRRAGNLVIVEVSAKAFCHQMVRSITGCLYTVGRGRRSPEWVADVLTAKDRQAVGQMAPPHGLTLIGVSYQG